MRVRPAASFIRPAYGPPYGPAYDLTYELTRELTYEPACAGPAQAASISSARPATMLPRWSSLLARIIASALAGR